MKANAQTIELWSLVRGNPSIDPDDLLAAIDDKLRADSLDFRTRLLVRESLFILQDLWGKERMLARLSVTEIGKINSLLENDPGEIGFPSLRYRVKNRTDVETILSFFRELGSESNESVRINVGGSSALILSDLLRRGTDDIDVVNEVPASLRTHHELLDSLTHRHGLMLTHFQSHYLPENFEARLRYYGRFRLLDVYLVDPLDIFVGKLFSRRAKDLDDLRMLESNFERMEILDRIKSSAMPLMSDPQSKENAERNWYIVFGQSLPW